MKCYYEELAIERDASESEIKTAYRKLALKWHPDKNLDSLEVAKERFQLIQQAYEVLSDPQERAWYDNHREQILRGKNSDYEDNCLDVFQYFTVSCFKGYGDDAKGFYAVYREVFEKLAAEDAEFMDDEEDLENIPKFGDSKSNYEDVVGPFYAYWSAYCTKRTYTWLCPYDIKDIKDRRILREIEKDMKKVVQKAKKERNEEVRNLVSFIRKRDKRVLVYKKVLEERAAFNRQKQEQNRLEQIRRRQQELEEMRQNSKIVAAHNDDYEEQLKQLEQQYSSDDEYYEEDIEGEDEDEDIENLNLEVDNTLESLDNDAEEEDEEDYIDDLYCVACNREFKTAKAFANHESSKKHRDNIEKLKLEMQQEEKSYQKEDKNLEEEDLELVLTDDDEIDALPEELVTTKTKSRKTKNKKETKKSKLLINSDEDLTATDEKEEEVIKPLAKMDLSDNDDKDGDDDWNSSKKSNKKSKNKTKTTKNKTNLQETFTTKPMEAKAEPRITIKPNSIPQSCDLEADNTEHVCVTCKSKFVSKNKLFSHLKLTNHGVYIPKAKSTNDDCGKSKKTKGKKK